MPTVRRLYAHTCPICPLRGSLNGASECGFLQDIKVADKGYPDDPRCPMTQEEIVLVSGPGIGYLEPVVTWEDTMEKARASLKGSR